MKLLKIHITNYKNYHDVQCEFHPQFNVITGLNGKGKTNLIDSIYYLGLTRSYFNHTETHNFRHETSFFRVQGNFQEKKKKYQIVAKVQKKAPKEFHNNKKKYDKMIDHIGTIPVVMIAPKDQLLIIEGSEERRRMMDGTISQLDSIYLQHLAEYKYILRQRNQLLKDYSKNRNLDLSLLDIYDKSLISAGTYIYAKRKLYLEEMKQVFQEKYALISGEQEQCNFKYKSQLHKGEYAEMMQGAREKDIIMQRSTMGIHKDDIVFFNEDNMIRYVGSQGQQKSFILALKLSQYELLYRNMQVKPIFLLDDIFDKLDSSRVLHLIKLLKDHDLGQVFITDTEKNRLKDIFVELGYSFALYKVENNTIDKYET